MHLFFSLGTAAFGLALGLNSHFLSPPLVAGELTADLTLVDVGGARSELRRTLEGSEPIIPAGLAISSNPAEGSRAVIGEDKRVPVTSQAYPWSAVGQTSGLAADGSAYICTGSLVAEDIVLTSAHCIIDAETGELARNIQFKPNLIDGQVASPDDIANVEPLLLGTDFADGRKPNPDDWALVALDQPLGQKYGTLGMAPLSTEALADQPFTENLVMMGYSGDFPVYNPGETASAHVGCSIVGEDLKMVLHLCDTYGGSSGGPILTLMNGEIRIVALNSGEVTKSETGEGLVNVAVKVPRILDQLRAMSN
ncbi:MAG: trypsin-like peptidase domain-containing protein [Nodosilinea sp. WJT8-NPBG4]|jgi:protease YdgD|nr:trypsin-like peptidase domain-containing protein [Nodosilinea sp. WJT8-NPBG4]